MKDPKQIEKTIDLAYSLIEQKDNIQLEIVFQQLCSDFNDIIDNRSDSNIIDLQFRCMACIIRCQLYADVNDEFVDDEMQMIRAATNCMVNPVLTELQLNQIYRLVNDIVRECNKYYERRGIRLPMPDVLKNFGKFQTKYEPIKINKREQTSHSCLLCGKLPATAKGSHLAPNFLIQSFLSYDGSIRRDREVVVETVLGSLAKDRKWGRNVKPEDIDKVFGVVPDKEKSNIKASAVTRDDLLCPQCEKRFSFIESKYSDYYNKRKETVSPEVSYLFWLGVFWRLHIAGWCIRLSDDDAYSIRKILDECMPNTQKDVDTLKANRTWGKFCYTLRHCSDTKSELLGLVGNHANRSPYKLLCGEYEITLYADHESAKDGYPINDYKSDEQCAEIKFIDFWKFKVDVLGEVEDKEFSSLNKNPLGKLLDLCKGDNGGENFKLAPYGAQELNNNNMASHVGSYAYVIPGSINKFMNYKASHPFDSQEKFWEGVQKTYGYTKEELQEMVGYWEDHPHFLQLKSEGSIKRHKQRKERGRSIMKINKARHLKAKSKKQARKNK